MSGFDSKDDTQTRKDGPLLADRYRLIAEVGRGGMGNVWRARDLWTDRDVAIKRLRPEMLRDARLRRRMRREARAVARLEHPNIVRLYDLGEDEDGAPFLAMEHVAGITLEAFGAKRPALDRILDVVDQILQGLAYAHARGVIHRDLKPQNVIVTQGSLGERVPKLLDFGFARVENDSDDQLSIGQGGVFGTPTYMAPEQATGDYEVGPTADIYAVGILLWELLCGTPPFQGRSGPAVVVQHVTASLPRFEPLPNLDVPDGLEEVLSQALEKEPADRFDSAAAMRRALAAVGGGSLDDSTLTHVGPPVFEAAITGAFTLEDADRTVEVTPIYGLQFDTVPTMDDRLLAGRDGLQRWLWGQVERVCEEGTARAVVLDGEVGVGLSQICAWLSQTLTEGGWMLPLTGRFRAGMRGAGIRGALCAALRLSPGAPDGSSEERLTGGLAEVDPEGEIDRAALSAYLWPTPQVPSAPGRAVEVVEKAARLLARRRPVFFWLDDLHHADAESLDLLAKIVQRFGREAVPVLLVVTRRLGSEAGRGFLDRYPDRVDARIVPRLDDDAIRTVVQQVVPLDEGAQDRVVRAASGNPLYAVLAVRLLRDAGALVRSGAAWTLRDAAHPLPPDLRGLMRARFEVAVARRTDGAALKALADRLAVLGAGFPFGLAEALVRRYGDATDPLESQVDALIRLGVLADEPGDVLCFAHDLLRQALVDEAESTGAARPRHARAAEAKTQWYADRLPLAAAEIAAHHRAAGAMHEGVEMLLLAARGRPPAEAAGLYAEAERWLAAAPQDQRTESLRADALIGRAETAIASRDAPLAQRFAARLEEVGRRSDDRARIALALRIRAEAMAMSGRGLGALGLLEEARQLFERLGDEHALARIALVAGRTALESGATDDARRRFEDGVERFARTGDLEGQAACQHALGELAVRSGDREEAVAALTEAAQLAQLSGDHGTMAHASWRLGELLRQQGEGEAAERRYAVAVDAFDAVGDLAGVGRSLRGQGDVQRHRRAPEATRTYLRAVEVFEAQGDPFQTAVCYTQLGRVAALDGDLAAARSFFERALVRLEPFDDPVRVGVLHAFLARVAHRQGDAASRDARLEAALRADLARPLVVAEWPRSLEEIAEGVVAGDRERATRLLVRAQEVWTALRRPEDAARCGRLLAALRSGSAGRS